MATDEDFLGPVRMPFFNNAESVYINGQEVQSIVVKDTGGILFQKSNDIENLPVMTLTVTGSSFETNSFTPFTYTGEVSVDWGDDTGLVEYTGGKLSHTFTDELNSHTVRVYGDITSLGYSCFASCTGLISVEIPSSVTTLGEACFGDCDKLTSIAIPSSVTSLGESCFAFCTSLTSITLPNSITSLENSCFESSGLTSITLPDSITRLGDGCFVECLNLVSVDIPDSVMVLGGSCFYHCISLTNYILNWTSSSTIITYDSTDMPNNTNTIFHIPAGTTQLYIDKGYPSDKLEEPPVMTLTVTGSSFETYSSTPFTYTGEVFVDWGDNTGLVKYTGGKLSHIFTDELNSHTVRVYGNLTSLGNNGFAVRNGLTQIIIPSSVTSIELGCFNTCSDLTSITIPEGVTSIGPSCFNACRGLTSITIPNSVTDLGTSCFNDCSGLTSIRFNWDSSTNILTYESTWIWNDGCKFIIPYGTTQLYIDKGYPSSKLEEEIPFNNIVLSTDKSVLSSYHNDSCTFTAQLMHDSTPINIAGVTVTFSVEDELEERHELDTAQTNASGVATMTYSVTNIAYEDMIATAEGFDSNICEIESCFYALNQQYDITRNGTTIVQRLNDDIISNLPAAYTIDFDMKTTNNPIANAEQRIYWAPNQLWTDNGSQPSLASFFGFAYISGGVKLEAGKRLSSKTDVSNSVTINANQWTHVRLENRGDNKFYHYYGDDNTYYTWWTVTGMSNYSDFIFGVILWSDTTFSIKNIKIKSTVPKIIKVDDDTPDGPEPEL